MKRSALAFASLPTCSLLLGCSPAAEPINKASAHYLVDFPQSAGVEGQCNQIAEAAIALDSDHTPDLPLAQSDVLPTSFGALAADGGQDNKIDCRIVSDGDGFRISATLEGPNVSPTVDSLSQGRTNLNISNAYVGVDGTGTGRIVLRTTATGVLSPKDGFACQLRAIPDTAEALKFQVSKGEGRFTFLCPNAVSSLDDFSTCETRGTVWLSDCRED